VSHVVSTFVSYAVEKRFSKHPEEFGPRRDRRRGRTETATTR